MLELWPLLIVASVLVALVYYFTMPRREAPVFESPREERLCRTLARQVGCSPADALRAVRQEIALAPAQSDAILINRAAYHYSQGLPEKPCQVYRDPVRG